MSRSTLIAGILTVAVLLAVLGFALMRRERAHAVLPSAAGAAPSYWYDPMHPSEHFDKPGRSSFMDMQLVPKFSDPEASAASSLPGSIAIDSRVAQNLGIRFASVKRSDFARRVTTVGLIGVDEHRIEAIQVREPGWVEQLEVRALGDSVRRGELLAGVYSPDLLATQQELLIARSSGDAQLLEAARRRLELFGLSNIQIARIERTGQVERRINYYAPIDGYVMELGVREGVAVEPGTTLFQLVDITSVWINAEVPEDQAAWIKIGDRAEAAVPALPGERFEGRIDYLYPALTPATRTLKVRIVTQNPRRTLRPGMFATTQLEGTPLRHVLTVPSESVIKTGTRSVVIVADDDQHFRPVLVSVGAEQGGRSEIQGGLTEGDRVVASGQFLFDSEANLHGAFDNLAGAKESKGDEATPMTMPMASPNGSH